MGEDEDEWNWSALASFANSRLKGGVNDHDLKRVGRDVVVDMLQDAARKVIHEVDLAEGERFLADFGLRNTCGWT